jgi:membrane-bound lytic murein transglycosylase B
MPTTPAQAARQIVAAEDAIADPETSPDKLAAAARIQQLAYRQLGRRPDWDARVQALLPERLVEVVGANIASRREFRSMHTDLSRTLPAWRIVQPAPAADLLRFYREAEREFGVGWEYLAAINLVETGMGRIRGTSVAGARGPMQFLPSTWARYGEGDVNSPRDAILAAGRYLAANGFARPGGKARALWRYNNHPAYVRGVTHLAKVMERRPRAFLGYYHWDVYYLTTEGDVLLPVGYEATRPIPAKRWLERHPQS